MLSALIRLSGPVKVWLKQLTIWAMKAVCLMCKACFLMTPIRLDIASDPRANVKEGSREVLVSIQKMTCHSCVRTIEDTLGEQEGIISVNVDLQAAQGHSLLFAQLKRLGRVVFDSARWTGEKIAEAINDMGYEAKLVSVQGMPSFSEPFHDDIQS